MLATSENCRKKLGSNSLQWTETHKLNDPPAYWKTVPGLSETEPQTRHTGPSRLLSSLFNFNLFHFNLYVVDVARLCIFLHIVGRAAVGGCVTDRLVSGSSRLASAGHVSCWCRCATCHFQTYTLFLHLLQSHVRHLKALLTSVTSRAVERLIFLIALLTALIF